MSLKIIVTDRARTDNVTEAIRAKQFNVAAYVCGGVQEWTMWAANLTEARIIANRELKKYSDLGGYIVSVEPTKQT